LISRPKTKAHTKPVQIHEPQRLKARAIQPSRKYSTLAESRISR